MVAPDRSTSVSSVVFSMSTDRPVEFVIAPLTVTSAAVPLICSEAPVASASVTPDSVAGPVRFCRKTPSPPAFCTDVLRMSMLPTFMPVIPFKVGLLIVNPDTSVLDASVIASPARMGAVVPFVTVGT